MFKLIVLAQKIVAKRATENSTPWIKSMFLYKHCTCLSGNIKADNFTNGKLLLIVIFPCIIDKTLLFAHYHVPKHCGRIQRSLHLQGDRSRHGYLGISCHGTPRLHRNRRWPPNGHKQYCINIKSQNPKKKHFMSLFTFHSIVL